MNNEPLIPCPIKETMVYPSTCEECTYTEEQCAAAMEALKGETRHCLDCKHYGKVQPCKACMSADDPRERLFWKYGPSDKEILACRELVEKEQSDRKELSKETGFPVGHAHGRIEETAQIPTLTEVKNLEQLKLF